MTPEHRARVQQWCHDNAPMTWKGIELDEDELFQVVESTLKLVDAYQQLSPTTRASISFLLPMLADLTAHPDLADLEAGLGDAP